MAFENPECELKEVLDKFQIDNKLIRAFQRVYVNKRLLDGTMNTDKYGIITITADRWTLTLNPNNKNEVVKHIVKLPAGLAYPDAPESIAGSIYGNGRCTIIG